MASPTHVDAGGHSKARLAFDARAMEGLTRRLTIGEAVMKTEAERDAEAELVVAAAAAAELCVVSSDLTAAGRA
jgi:hypothetical protein